MIDRHFEEIERLLRIDKLEKEDLRYRLKVIKAWKKQEDLIYKNNMEKLENILKTLKKKGV